MPAKLYRVEEVTEPGILPAGCYVAVRQGRVIIEFELEKPTNPRDLVTMVPESSAA